MLDAESARTGRSISALIRAAVDEVYGSERSADDDLAGLARSFGCWEGRDEGGEAWVERMRSGRRLSKSG